MPARLGPARRHYHLLDQLARFYDVHLLTFANRDERADIEHTFGGRLAGLTCVPRAFGRRGRHVRKLARTLTGRCDFLPAADPNLRAACARTGRTIGADAIVLSSLLLRSLPLPPRVRVVADTHNVEFDVLRRTAAHADRVLMRAYAGMQWPATFREERRSVAAVDLLLATSPRDRELFERDLGAHHVEVIANGIDLSECLLPRDPDPHTILFTGLMSYYPNQQGVRWFLDEVFPSVLRMVPNARLVIAGAAPPGWLLARRSPRVDVTGFVADMRPYLQRATCVVAPLMIGGGTRVKILEALALERPVVSTRVGAEGLDLVDGESVLLADRADAFAGHVARVLRDRAFAARLGRLGRRHVSEHFDWDRLGERLRDLLALRIGLRPRAERLLAAPEPRTARARG